MKVEAKRGSGSDSSRMKPQSKQKDSYPETCDTVQLAVAWTSSYQVEITDAQRMQTTKIHLWPPTEKAKSVVLLTAFARAFGCLAFALRFCLRLVLSLRLCLRLRLRFRLGTATTTAALPATPTTSCVWRRIILIASCGLFSTLARSMLVCCKATQPSQKPENRNRN